MTTASIASALYQVTLRNGQHEMQADEPMDQGGGDTGPGPDALLEASLASCTAITLRMYANRKNWSLSSINVLVNLERKEGKTLFTRTIDLQGELDQTQKNRLLEIAKACPVSRTLLGEIHIDSQLK
jgi:putative redox protein